MHEARALAGLTHPNVLTVFETGVHDGVVFIVTEFIHGGNLRDWLAATPEASRREKLLPVLVQIARGLEASHRRGLVRSGAKTSTDGPMRSAKLAIARRERSMFSR